MCCLCAPWAHAAAALKGIPVLHLAVFIARWGQCCVHQLLCMFNFPILFFLTQWPGYAGYLWLAEAKQVASCTGFLIFLFGTVASLVLCSAVTAQWHQLSPAGLALLPRSKSQEWEMGKDFAEFLGLACLVWKETQRKKKKADKKAIILQPTSKHQGSYFKERSLRFKQASA